MAGTQARKPQTGRATRPAPLPPISVAKFEEIGRLVERLIEEKTSVFIDNQQVYRDAHREGTRRPLNAAEAAQIVASLGEALGSELDENPLKAVADVQTDGRLFAYDDPQPLELLLAAGISTAPALIDATKRLVALIEMDTETFKQARESDQLDDAIDDAAKETEYEPLPDGRARAARALQHFADSAGVEPGEAMRLLSRVVGQALGQAMQITTAGISDLASLIGSLEPTGGLETSASTESPTETSSPTSE